MKKRFLALFMSLVMMCSLAVPTYADDISGGSNVSVSESSDSGDSDNDGGDSGSDSSESAGSSESVDSSESTESSESTGSSESAESSESVDSNESAESSESDNDVAVDEEDEEDGGVITIIGGLINSTITNVTNAITGVMKSKNDDSLYEEMMSAGSVANMWDMLVDYLDEFYPAIQDGSISASDKFTQDELVDMYNRATAYNEKEDGKDQITYQDLVTQLDGLCMTWYNMTLDTLLMLANTEEFDDLDITGTYTISKAVEIKNNDNGGEANWAFKNGGETLNINANVFIPSGESLDIIVAENDKDNHGTINAGSSTITVSGTLKIAKTINNNDQNHGEITLNGGTILVKSGGTLMMQDIKAIKGTTKIVLESGANVVQLFGDIPVSGTLTVTGVGTSSVIKAKQSIGDYMFKVNKAGSLNFENVVVDGGSSDGYQNRIMRVVSQDKSDDKLELSAINSTFRNATYDSSRIFEFDSNSNTKFTGGTITNCKNTTTSEGIIYLPTDKDDDDNYTPAYRTFEIDGTTITHCKSELNSGAGGVIRTNGGTYVYITIKNALFENNYSGGWGNILWNAIGKCTIDNCTFNNNESDKRGGAISSEGQNIEITNCTFINNKAGDFGGAICLFPYRLAAKDATSTDSIIKMNVTIGNGCKFENNYATKGGAVAVLVTSSTSTKATDLAAVIDLGETGYMCNNYTNAANETGTSEGEGGGAIYAGCTEKNKDENGKIQKASRITVDIKSGSIYGNYSTGKNGGAILVDDLRTDNTGINQVTVSGGTIGGNTTPNTAKNGGAVAIEKGNFEMTGGTISYNKATANGGAVYVSGGNYTMSGGTVKNNSAVDGGAAYVTAGNFTLSGGDITSNTVTNNGGGAYITGGNFTMSGGSFITNTASYGNGGAIYVNANNGIAFTMTNGEINQNSAKNGGAVYVAQGNVDILHGILNSNTATDDGGAIYMNAQSTSTALIFESGKMVGNTAADDGGAIFATRGTLRIGLLNCDGSDNNDHTSKAAGRYHPEITGNHAGDCGGGIALDSKDGEVYFYCGQILSNTALYEGVGYNVFMKGGTFWYGNEDMNIGSGSKEDPQLVVVGGSVVIMPNVDNTITVNYYSDNTSATSTPYTGIVEKDLKFNLPDAEYFFEDEHQGWVFVGWTGHALGDGGVRTKDDYIGSGTVASSKQSENPEKLQDGNVNDDQMDLYAVWAPATNSITYVDSLTYDVMGAGNNRVEYSINQATAQEFAINAPNNHSGFAVVGWYLYQKENQNANWCDKVGNDYVAYEPVYKTTTNKTYQGLDYTVNPSFDGTAMKYFELPQPNATLNLKVPKMTFGDIVLIPDYELVYGDLTITKEGWKEIDPGQTFIFNVKSELFAANATGIQNQEILDEIAALKAVDLNVVIEGDGSVTIKHLPFGTYTVTEDTDWSWRYTPDFVEQTATVDVSNTYGEDRTLDAYGMETVNFKNTRENNLWMDGNAYCKNKFESGGLSSKLKALRAKLNI